MKPSEVIVIKKVSLQGITEVQVPSFLIDSIKQIFCLNLGETLMIKNNNQNFEFVQLENGVTPKRYQVFSLVNLLEKNLKRTFLKFYFKFFQNNILLKKLKKNYDDNMEMFFNVVNTGNAVHNVECSNCQAKKIIGVRYKCSACRDYNLCLECKLKLNTNLNIHEHKTFLEIIDPDQYLSDLRNKIENRPKTPNPIHQDNQVNDSSEEEVYECKFYDDNIKLIELDNKNNKKVEIPIITNWSRKMSIRRCPKGMQRIGYEYPDVPDTIELKGKVIDCSENESLKKLIQSEKNIRILSIRIVNSEDTKPGEYIMEYTLNYNINVVVNNEDKAEEKDINFHILVKVTIYGD